MTFCHKTQFCGRYYVSDLRQTGGPEWPGAYFRVPPEPVKVWFAVHKNWSRICTLVQMPHGGI